ncbi:hypothetical protein Tco_1212154 [Tanacetum coccineum]
MCTNTKRRKKASRSVPEETCCRVSETIMIPRCLKFNLWLQRIAVNCGENDVVQMSRVHTLYDATVGGEFKASEWIQLFLKGKLNSGHTPIRTLQKKKIVLLGTARGSGAIFGDDDLPRPTGLQRLAKSQRTGSTRH